MTKFKMNSDSNNGSQVTLTSYMIGGTDNGEINHGYDSTNDLTKDQNICIGCQKKNNNALFNLPDSNYLRNRTKPTMKERLLDKVKKGCTRKVLYKRIPILSWLPSYNLDYAICDLVAGVTVGLTVIPQAIAYANIAGLPPQIGLYSSFLGCFFYTIFGSCKDSAVGPTAISALLTRENIHGLGPAGATIFCFLNGCVVFLMGVFQCGFLIDFVSGPVSVGFTSAAAIIIATTQMKDILGLPYPGGDFVIIWEQIIQHISETRFNDAALGIGTILVLLLLRSIKNIRFGSGDDEKEPVKAFLNKSLWLISTARNIIVVCVTAAIAYLFEIHGSQPFRLTGYVKPGLPDIVPPEFEINMGNTTRSFMEVTSTIGTGLLVIPLLCILENVALAKVFADGKAIDATQEMFALGICNIASSFVQSMPVSGALSRGAVNNASGVRTTCGGIYTAIIVMLSLKFLTPCFSYIPKASLAGIIVAAVVFMVEIQVVKPMWRTKKTDLIPATATFLGCLLLRLEVGIILGIAINIMFLLYQSARPSVRVEKSTTPSGCDYLLITPDRSLAFPSVEYVRNTVSKAGIKQGSSSIPVVVDARHIQAADYTAANGIKSLIDDFYQRNQAIIFFNLKPRVSSIFQGVGPKQFIHCNTYQELNQLLQKHCKDTKCKIKMIDAHEIIDFSM
ncbi:sodium-independent sulfate anion transporter-like [Coccinella septempunctata]|uniref:sodium-independent sulfate anion transporter-like n=1 Tax=Coccinella septempunctata TaxID=41139 RepID=UPI001D08916A|nr:sodium-independent sulfate anion transporter-like [Coccinella septempunctata]XP_044759832.1 sodium-independent sulfate anion transporter-like [Coccinella septempunctata]